MSVTLEDFTKDLIPAERAGVVARTEELFEQKLTATTLADCAVEENPSKEFGLFNPDSATLRAGFPDGGKRSP